MNILVKLIILLFNIFIDYLFFIYRVNMLGFFFVFLLFVLVEVGGGGYYLKGGFGGGGIFVI